MWVFTLYSYFLCLLRPMVPNLTLTTQNATESLFNTFQKRETLRHELKVSQKSLRNSYDVIYGSTALMSSFMDVPLFLKKKWKLKKTMLIDFGGAWRLFSKSNFKNTKQKKMQQKKILRKNNAAILHREKWFRCNPIEFEISSNGSKFHSNDTLQMGYCLQNLKLS